MPGDSRSQGYQSAAIAGTLDAAGRYRVASSLGADVNGGGSLLDRAFGAALVILGIALMLNWAWSLLRPLIPVFVVVAVIGASVAAAVGYYRNRW